MWISLDSGQPFQRTTRFRLKEGENLVIAEWKLQKRRKKVVFSSSPRSLYLTLAINTRDWPKLEIISLREEDKRYKLSSDFISL